MKKISFLILGLLCAAASVSCSVRTHKVIADHARSADAILIPLENPVVCKVGDNWYLEGHTAQVKRYNLPVLETERNPDNPNRPERYYLVSEREDFEPIYAPMPEELATSLLQGQYTHTDAIHFLKSKWSNELPEGDVQQWKTSATTPDYFRNMSSHLHIQREEDSYLIAHLDELSADFNALYVYPMAGLSALLIDAPGTFIIGPPTVKKPSKAQPEEL